MATTNYVAMLGRLRAQESGGARLDYLTDARGSVTANVDSSQIVQDTYRYKPFGSVLAHTGITQPQRFTFFGRHGVDARFAQTISYSDAGILLWASTAQVTSRSETIPFGRSPYSLWAKLYTVDCKPFPGLLLVRWPEDPQCVADKVPGGKVCLGFDRTPGINHGEEFCVGLRYRGCTRWVLPPSAPTRGAVVQHIQRFAGLSDCSTQPSMKLEVEYYEAWILRDGKLYDSFDKEDSGDYWRATLMVNKNQRKRLEVKGYSFLCEGYDPLPNRGAAKWLNGAGSMAGTLWFWQQFGSAPPGWPESNAGAVKQQVSLYGHCCCVNDRWDRQVNCDEIVP